MTDPPAPGDRVITTDDETAPDPSVGRVLFPTPAQHAWGTAEMGTDLEICVLVRWGPTYIRWEYLDDLTMWAAA